MYIKQIGIEILKWSSESEDVSYTKMTKEIVPEQGVGTRFLPIDKSKPKEMLSVVDRPTI